MTNKINRNECPHNHDKKFCDAHDFDYHYSQKCGNGCGYSQGDLVEELEVELAQLQSKLDCAVKALEEISIQAINEDEYEEKGGDDYNSTDHREGYEHCVKRARLALEEIGR